MTPLLQARALLKQKQLDGILFSSATHISYLTGYNGFSEIERDAYFLVTENRAYVFTNPLYAEEVKSLPTIRAVISSPDKPFIKNLSEIVTKEGLERVGFESDNITVTEYLRLTENITSHFISVDLRELRVVKTSDEVERIKLACEIANKALKKIMNKIEPGISELYVANAFEIEVIKLGGRLSFPTIIAFGKNAAVPHHHTDMTKLKTNDTVLIDCGVKVDNYCSDMTRTFFVGKPTKEQEKVYNTVKESQQLAVKLIDNLLRDAKPIPASEIDTIAREHIISQGYPSIPHSLGHGIGIEVHEAPSLSINSKDLLKEGMVFSIEPGIYLEGKFGVRIEDLYTIRGQKLIHLT